MGTQLWALASEHATHAKRRLLAEGDAYDNAQRVLLPGYAGSLAAFTATTAALALAGRR